MKNKFKSKVVLAIGAHPDDVEFGCGATMAMVASSGAKLYFAIATDGNRGSRQHHIEKKALVDNRKSEQLEAAKILGAEEVIFLDEEDGNLIADLSFKKKVVKLIRTLRPDMIFTHDPSWFYQIDSEGISRINHNDHRACGQAVIDAVYPLARDLQSFPDHIEEGLQTHIVPELYLWSALKPNFYFDVSGFVEAKIAAIAAHKSQIDEPEVIGKRMTDRAKQLGRKNKTKFAEGFVRLAFD